MSNEGRAKKWMADNRIKDSGSRAATLTALLDEAEQRGANEPFTAAVPCFHAGQRCWPSPETCTCACARCKG